MVDRKDSQPTPSAGPLPAKKAYRKPSVQVYGTLLEMTHAVNGDVGHPPDGGTNVAGSRAHNRT